MKPLGDLTHRMLQSSDSGFNLEGGGAEVFRTPTFAVVESYVLRFSLVEAWIKIQILVFLGTLLLIIFSL